jgi:phthiocerol/phenolphthiocerol synthesis type-I polyketide synthase D
MSKTLGFTEQQLRGMLVSSIASLAGLPVSDVDADEELTAYGVGSTEALIVVGELESICGRELPATLVFEHVTINRIVRALCLPAQGPGTTAS